jgi:hypothetical protein
MTLKQALRKAYQLGQIYWQQADSESYKENKKSSETSAKFDALLQDAIDAHIAQHAEMVDRLKLEAQCHTQEARTANATIVEIYQLCSGGKGEPGNWHGAEPVRALLGQHAEMVAKLRELADSWSQEESDSSQVPFEYGDQLREVLDAQPATNASESSSKLVDAVDADAPESE